MNTVQEKFLSSNICPNDMEGGDFYMLTLTYTKSQGYTPEWQFWETINEVINKLNGSCNTFVISPELTKTCQIHYHIILSIKDKIHWYRNALPSFKRNGHIYIKKVFNLEKALEYIRKDSKFWSELMDYKFNFPICSTEKVLIQKLSRRQLKVKTNLLRQLKFDHYHNEVNKITENKEKQDICLCDVCTT